MSAKFLLALALALVMALGLMGAAYLLVVPPLAAPPPASSVIEVVLDKSWNQEETATIRAALLLLSGVCLETDPARNVLIGAQIVPTGSGAQRDRITWAPGDIPLDRVLLENMTAVAAELYHQALHKVRKDTDLFFETTRGPNWRKKVIEAESAVYKEETPILEQLKLTNSALRMAHLRCPFARLLALPGN